MKSNVLEMQPNSCNLTLHGVCSGKIEEKKYLCPQNCRFECKRQRNFACDPKCNMICLPGCPITGPRTTEDEAGHCCKCKCGMNEDNYMSVNWKMLSNTSYNNIKYECSCICHPNSRYLVEEWFHHKCIRCACPLATNTVNDAIPSAYTALTLQKLPRYDNFACPHRCLAIAMKSCSNDNDYAPKCDKSCRFKCNQAGEYVGCQKGYSLVCDEGCSLTNITEMRFCKCMCLNDKASSHPVNWTLTSNLQNFIWNLLCECECPPITDTCPEKAINKACHRCSCPTLTTPIKEKAILTTKCPSCKSSKCNVHRQPYCEKIIANKIKTTCPAGCAFKCDSGQTSACPIHCTLACDTHEKRDCRCLCQNGNDTETYEPVAWLKVLEETNMNKVCSCMCPVSDNHCKKSMMLGCFYCKCPIDVRKSSNTERSKLLTKCLSCQNRNCLILLNKTCKAEIAPKPTALCDEKCSFECLKGVSPGCGLNCRLICDPYCPFKGNAATQQEVTKCCRCVCHNSFGIRYFDSVNWAAVVSTKSFNQHCSCICKLNSWNCPSKGININCFQCRCPLNQEHYPITKYRIEDMFQCVKCPSQKCEIVKKETCQTRIQQSRLCRDDCQFKCKKGQSPGCNLNCRLVCLEGCPFYGSQSDKMNAGKCCKCLCEDSTGNWYTEINWAAILSSNSFGEHCHCDCEPKITHCKKAIDTGCFRCQCQIYSHNSQKNIPSSNAGRCLSCLHSKCKLVIHKECRTSHYPRQLYSLQSIRNINNGRIWRKLIEEEYTEIDRSFLYSQLCDENCGIQCDATASSEICKKNCTLSCLPNCPFNRLFINWEEAKKCCRCLCHEQPYETMIINDFFTSTSYENHCRCSCPPSYKHCSTQNIRLNCYDCICPLNSEYQNQTLKMNYQSNSCLTCPINCELKVKNQCQRNRYKYYFDTGIKSRANDMFFHIGNTFFYDFELSEFEGIAEFTKMGNKQKIFEEAEKTVKINSSLTMKLKAYHHTVEVKLKSNTSNSNNKGMCLKVRQGNCRKML